MQAHILRLRVKCTATILNRLAQGWKGTNSENSASGLVSLDQIRFVIYIHIAIIVGDAQTLLIDLNIRWQPGGGYGHGLVKKLKLVEVAITLNLRITVEAGPLAPSRALRGYLVRRRLVIYVDQVRQVRRLCAHFKKIYLGV